MTLGVVKGLLSRICSLLLLVTLNLTYGHAQMCQLSDDFTGTSLDPAWSEHQPQFYSAEVSNGHLTIDIDGTACNNNCPWFHSQSAGFIYKDIVGDFEVVAAIASEEASGINAGDDISNDTQLGGLMARNKNGSTENYVFNVVGTRFDVPSIETKSTTNDNSGTIEHFAIGTTRSELRITREGSTFRMYSRELGAADWTHRSTFSRPDLPDTLQVGIIAYAFQSYPEDLAVKVDYIRFSEFTQVNQWLGGHGMWSNQNMWSLNQVPDSSHHVIINNPQTQTIQILSGENFNCHCLEVNGPLTELIVEGELHVGQYKLGCN